MYDLKSYDYYLPERLIAQEPANPRDSSRLMVLHRNRGTIEHRLFKDLPEYLDSQDLVIANNSKVIKARLLGRRLNFEQGRWVSGGKVEFFLLEQLKPRIWEGLFQASARKYVPGIRFEMETPDGHGLRATLISGSENSPTGTVVAEFDRDPLESGAGEVPLPPYIERASRSDDDRNYQTVYSRSLGSAAAPTAGLHFTQDVLNQIAAKGASWEEVTLHVGLGTFRPVKVQDIRNHKMHEERYEIRAEVAERVTQWKREKGRILAVGTTSVRTLESAWAEQDEGGSLKPGIGRSSLFIYPDDFRFRVVDRMLTNFHLPKSSLLMLVCAFAGTEFVMSAYDEAIRKEYRFFSYGDAMLVV